MWKRRFLSSVIAVLLAALTAVLGVDGNVVFLAIAVIVPLAMLVGFGAEVWLSDRRHRSLS
jgi:phosphopantothenate synthetase